jgi:hypothetical protein
LRAEGGGRESYTAAEGVAGGKEVVDRDRLLLIKECLQTEAIRLSQDCLNRFAANVQGDMDAFLSARAEGTFRHAHNQLAALWELAADEDPSPALIRARIDGLSARAATYVERRFPLVVTRLFPERPIATSFRDWARSADPENLILVARVVVAEGAIAVLGRRRGQGKRSASRTSPIVMGVARGDPTAAKQGGRPKNDSKIDLVMRLALSWLDATEQEPKPGRGDRTGFGELVFLVFEWLGLLDQNSEESGVHALRQYWATVEAGRNERSSRARS